MTPDEFRALVLGQAGIEERAHMGHPDFRLGGRVVATLGYPKDGWAMIRLPPEDQRFLLQAEPAFEAAKGAWGKAGCTLVRLGVAPRKAVEEAVEIACKALVPKPKVGTARKVGSRRPKKKPR